jgi:hypothetical protein
MINLVEGEVENGKEGEEENLTCEKKRSGTKRKSDKIVRSAQRL